MRVGNPFLLGMLWLVAASPAEAAAAVTNTLPAQYRQIGSRFGLTPQQVAQVYTFIDSQLDVIDAAAREKQVNITAFRAIARELGLRSYGADPGELIDAIRKQAADAAKFQTDNAALRQELATLQDTRSRTAAEQMLSRADAAYNRGDLEGAQAALEQLVALRSGELASAGEAWESAIQAAISLAATRGDLDRLDRLVDEAETARSLRAAQQREAERHGGWENRMVQVGAYVGRAASRVRFVQGRLRGDNETLLRAISICRENAVPLAPRDIAPDDWAETQSFLGAVLRMLGELEDGTIRLQEAVALYRTSAEVQTRERDPIQWAATQNAIGDALRLIGERESGTAALAEAVTAHRNALEAYSRAGQSTTLTLRELGYALNALARRERELGQGENMTTSLKGAVEVYRALLAGTDRARAPGDWADAQDNLGLALTKLAFFTGQTGILKEAVVAYRQALEEQVRDQGWAYAATQIHLGDVLTLLSESEHGTETLEQAVAAYRTALQALGERESTAPRPGTAMDVVNAAVVSERVSVDWGRAQISLAGALATIADSKADKVALDEAWRLVSEAGAFVRQANPSLVRLSDSVASKIQEIANRQNWTLSVSNKPIT